MHLLHFLTSPLLSLSTKLYFEKMSVGCNNDQLSGIPFALANTALKKHICDNPNTTHVPMKTIQAIGDFLVRRSIKRCFGDGGGEEVFVSSSPNSVGSKRNNKIYNTNRYTVSSKMMSKKDQICLAVHSITNLRVAQRI